MGRPPFVSPHFLFSSSIAAEFAAGDRCMNRIVFVRLAWPAISLMASAGAPAIASRGALP